MSKLTAALFLLFAAVACADDPAKIRMWTGAKPCPMTQQMFGKAITGGRSLNVAYGYTGIGAWSTGVKNYAIAVQIQATKKATTITKVSEAITYLKSYANAHKSAVTALVTACATQLSGMAESTSQAGNQAKLPFGSPFKSSTVEKGGVIVGKFGAAACAEMCAFASALVGATSTGEQARSCSAAVAHGTGKNDKASMRVAVSGPAADQPSDFVFPSTVTIKMKGLSDKTVAPKWVKDTLPTDAKTAHYDSKVVPGKKDQATSPALEGQWQTAAGIGGNNFEKFGSDVFSNQQRRNTWGNRGGCSEDKLVYDFVSVASVEK